METSPKQKKITVKFFLNEAVEPVTGEGRQKYYPLYVQVTYNRKNMQFKSKYSEYYRSLEEVKPGLLQFEEKVIKKMITYEVAEEKGDYDMKGLKDKYEIYSTSILEALENYLKPKLRLAVLKTKSELAHTLNFHDNHATASLLYQAARKLFTDFDIYLSEKLKEELEAYHHYQKGERPVLTYRFPTVIEWMDGSYKSEVGKKIMTPLKNKPQLIKELKTLIDQAVEKKTKDLTV